MVGAPAGRKPIKHWPPHRGVQNRFHHFLELNGSFKPKSRVSCSRLHLECARPKQSGPIVVLGGAEHGPPLIEFMKARVNVDVAG